MFKQTLVLLSIILFANATCNSTNILQWDCYTVGSEKTMTEVAQKFNMISQKLCDYNSWELRGACDQAPTGVSIRIPNNTCTSREGNFNCYIVKKGDTLQSIVKSLSPVRNETMLKEYNQDLLWGQNEVQENMFLRLPIKTCQANMNLSQPLICHIVKQGEDISSVAALYDISADEIFTLNADILGNIKTVIADMQLLVPYKASVQPSPCVDNEDFGCYTVEQGETLWNISVKVGHDPFILGEMNGIEVTNHTVIYPGQVLTYNKYKCDETETGNYVCMTAPVDIYGSINTPIPVPALATMIPAPFVGLGWWNYNGKAYYDLFMEVNKDVLSCKNLTGYYVNECQAYANQTLKFPVVHCVSDNEYTCYYAGDQKQDSYNVAYDIYNIGGKFFYDEFNQVVMGSMYAINPYSEVRTMLPTPEYYGPNCVNTPGEHICYKIQQQETVFTIGQKFEYNWKDLCTYNNLTSCDKIQYSGSLKIPIIGKTVESQELFLA